MSRCRHRLVAEYLTAKRRRPIPANYRPGHGAAWHPGVLRLVCVTCGEYVPLGPARDTAETEVEVRAAALAQATRDEREGRADETWTDDENDGWNYHRQGWTPPAGYEAGWLAREIWTDESATVSR